MWSDDEKKIYQLKYDRLSICCISYMESRIYSGLGCKGFSNGTRKNFFRANSVFRLEIGKYIHFRQLLGKKNIFGTSLTLYNPAIFRKIAFWVKKKYN